MYDIVGSLPLELVIYIVEHLNPEDMVRNQRVGIFPYAVGKLELSFDCA